jgi:hypothetical protein
MTKRKLSRFQRFLTKAKKKKKNRSEKLKIKENDGQA